MKTKLEKHLKKNGNSFLKIEKKLDFKNSYAAKGSAQAGEMAQPLGTCTAL